MSPIYSIFWKMIATCILFYSVIDLVLSQKSHSNKFYSFQKRQQQAAFYSILFYVVQTWNIIATKLLSILFDLVQSWKSDSNKLHSILFYSVLDFFPNVKKWYSTLCLI